MANINWNRHAYTSKLESDYWNNPSKGFDSKWHKANKIQKQAAQAAKLREARQKIKALRNN